MPNGCQAECNPVENVGYRTPGRFRKGALAGDEDQIRKAEGRLFPCQRTQRFRGHVARGKRVVSACVGAQPERAGPWRPMSLGVRGCGSFV